MSVKAKILSFLLLLLIITPIVLAPTSNGNVLGVIEDNSTNQIATQGEIAGGIIETKEEDNEVSKEVTGKAVLNSNKDSSKVISSQFEVATGIQVKHNDITLDLVVQKKDSNLEEDTLLALDRKTFQQLGVNPDETAEVEVTVKK